VAADDKLKDELEEHLRILQRKGHINIWHREQVRLNEKWSDKQNEYLQKAHVILLLISSDFLASDEVYYSQVTKAIDRHNNKEAYVIPVVLRDCLWQEGIFKDLQPLPQNGKAITSAHWSSKDEAFTAVTVQLKAIIEQFTFNNEGKLVYKNTEEQTIGIKEPTTINEVIGDVDKPPDDAFILPIFWLASIPLAIAALFIIVAVYNNFYPKPANPDISTIGSSDKNLLEKIEGTWLNVIDVDESFIAKLVIDKDGVGVYSRDAQREYYWGKEIASTDATKVVVKYDKWNIAFDIEPNDSTQPLDSIVAIYSDSIASFGIQNAHLVREKLHQEIIAQLEEKNKSEILDTIQRVVNGGDSTVILIVADTSTRKIRKTISLFEHNMAPFDIFTVETESHKIMPKKLNKTTIRKLEGNN